MVTSRVQPLADSLRRAWSGGLRIERAAVVVAAVLFTSGLVHLGVLVVSGGTWLGPLSMRKAVTFGLSFGLTLASVVWATTFLRMGPRARRVLITAFTIACVVEVALVTTQAWRHVPSHFNFETGFDTAVSTTLAIGGGVIVATAIGWTIAAFRTVAQAPPSVRLAVRFGFVALLIALGVGAAMIATGSVAARGGSPEVAYTTAGALKPAHAVAMHAILVVPGMAWLLTFTPWTERTRTRIVASAVVAYLALIVVVVLESVTHVSPLDPPLAAAVVSALALGGVLVTGGLALLGVARVTGGASAPGSA
ncbi:hypothetical protein [Labedaea rhizosphaerae]|uniref:Uncharacterized protein n=1 Tax=Labedaea rhizosphaerae TaxID=598644 RepID=A0A4R6SCX7_LABRH|nr:hypothetical protein [Labedaea rhizosphaerae]TDP97534.1 hypothetical protein EV186_103498 [Labedaea rhizosphaerae]